MYLRHPQRRTGAARDVRPEAERSREIRGLYEAIATQTPGVQLSEMLPQLAARSNRYCSLRSMSHEDAVHVTAVHTMLTGQRDGSRSNESPSWAR
ncbi:MAG: DUF1501 domain-containing protein [Planctomycetaceae bacterium]